MPSTKTTPVLMRLEHELIDRMDALVSEQGFSSRSALAREALRVGLDLLESGSKGLTPASGRKPKKGQAAEILRSFADQALEAARRVPGRQRFGDDRVFIAHAWKRFQKSPAAAGMDLEAFKAQLLEANRERLLSLVCADMAAKLDQATVRESAIGDLVTGFHFICI
jgi:Arc/MetJ-type ribon-helix-helix transcriptional regulator